MWQRLYSYAAILLAFVLPLSTALTNVALGILCVLYGISGRYHEKLRVSFLHPVSLIAICFFCLFVIGGLYSTGPVSDILKMIQKMAKLLVIPVLIPALQEKRYRDYALWAFLASVSIMVVASYIKVGFGLHHIYGHGSGVFKDYIHTSLIVSLATFIVAHQASVSKIPQRYFYFILTIFLFYLFFINEARSGYIVVSSLSLLWLIQKGGFGWLMKGLVGMTILLAAVYQFSPAFETRWNMAYQEAYEYRQGKAFSSVGQRLEFYYHTWQLAKQKPLFGWGTGSFKSVYHDYAEREKLQPTHNPHNEYLNIMLQLGAIGMIGLTVFILVVAISSHTLPALQKYTVQGVLVAMLIGSLGNSWLMDFSSGYLFMLLLAISFSYDVRLQSKR